MFSFEENRVVIPIVVIEEIDQFKKGVDEKSRNARQIGRYLDSLRGHGSLQDGVKTEQGNIIQITVNTEVSSAASKLFFADRNDNLIIGTALYFKEKYPESLVTLVSKDANVRIKADCVGLNAENYETDNVKFDEYYTGWDIENVPTELLRELEEKKYIANSFGALYPNQYLKLVDQSNPDKYRIVRYHAQHKSLYLLKEYHGQEVFGITARNDEQQVALDLLLDDNIRLVSLSGIAGTGKPLLAMAAGLQKINEEEKYSRLVISRPISPIGKDLGYLP